MDWRFFLILVVIASIQVTSGIYNSEAHAQRFLSVSSDRLYALYNGIADHTYNIDNKPFFEALEEDVVARNISALVLEISTEARKYNTDRFQNTEVIKGIQKLRSAGLFALGTDFFSSLTTSLVGLQSTATDKDICDYIRIGECGLAYVPHIRKIFSTSLNPRELEYYWKEWREKQLSYLDHHFINLIVLFRRAARINGMTPREFWFRNYDDPLFFDDMETVMQQLKPFYQEFHAYIRKELTVKYGRAIMNEDGPIPDHLIEQVLLQAWKKQSVLSQSYPKQRLPNLQEGLEARGFSSTKILNHAEDFYRSLGLDPIPSSIRLSRFKEISPEANRSDCKADIFDRTPNVYMKYCKALHFKHFLQTHGYLGRIHYALEKKNLPFYFFPSFDLDYPLGEAVILSASTPEHLNRAEILQQYNYTSELAMNRLFRMGVHTVFNLALFFVNTKVMVDILESRVPIEEANSHYWKLMDEYAGIEPPVDRKKKYIDFSYKFYDDLAYNHQTRKFVSEILGYQMYESFCLISGSYVAGDPNKPLHACDFYGNKDVGIAMKKMMEIGSRLTYREAMSRAVQGTPAMSANSLLEYYEPLHEWLKEKNRLSRTRVGWSPSTKVVL